MSRAGFCQHDAGVLKDDKLSPGAKQKFIDDVKNWLVTGEPNLPIPCGPKFPAVPFADRIMLEDEKQYPEWHANVLGTYEKIAKALDFKSQFTILPICDPLALAVALNIDPPKLSFPDEFILFGMVLPLLAYKLGFDIPIELALKFPDLLTIPPGINLKLPLPPDFNIEIFFDLFKFAVPFPKFPDLLLGLMLKMPQLFLKILAFDFSVPCDVVLDAGLFGPFDPNVAIVWAVSQAVLASKTAECLVIAMTGATVGSASAGITGAEGTFFGYEPPPMETSDDDGNVRDKIVAAAKSMDGESWSKDFAELQAKGSYIEANLKYTQFLLPNIIFPSPPEVPLTDKMIIRNTQTAFEIAKTASSCGMFLRGCYYRAGARDPFFRLKYQPATAISGLIKTSDKNEGNLFDGVTSKEIPALKRGDCILVQDPNRKGSEHVLMITKDYAGGNSGVVDGIEGGQADLGNPISPNGTAIKAAQYEFSVNPKTGYVSAGRVGDPDPRQILRIMDGERMVLGPPDKQNS